jgi:hypothetical protein
MMRELLRVSMNEKQVKQACEDWARSRSRADGAAAQVIFLYPTVAQDLTQDLTAEVIFTKKRERKVPKVAGP